MNIRSLKRAAVKLAITADLVLLLAALGSLNIPGIVCTVLAAAGLFAAGWALFGWCVLPQRREAVTVYRLQACEPQLERQVRAFVWARESGLAAGRLVLAGGEETPETEALARQLAQAYACVEYVSCSECYGGSG